MSLSPFFAPRVLSGVILSRFAIKMERHSHVEMEGENKDEEDIHKELHDE